MPSPSPAPLCPRWRAPRSAGGRRMPPSRPGGTEPGASARAWGASVRAAAPAAERRAGQARAERAGVAGRTRARRSGPGRATPQGQNLSLRSVLSNERNVKFYTRTSFTLERGADGEPELERLLRLKCVVEEAAALRIFGEDK